MSWHEAHVSKVCSPDGYHYDGVVMDWGYTADIIVDGQVVVELKAVERTQPLHDAQLLTYLRLSPCRIGLLINFNTVSLTDGIKRCVL
jgi:GxxExxY protein